MSDNKIKLYFYLVPDGPNNRIGDTEDSRKISGRVDRNRHDHQQSYDRLGLSS
jgi:hypothetical protein